MIGGAYVPSLTFKLIFTWRIVKLRLNPKELEFLLSKYILTLNVCLQLKIKHKGSSQVKSKAKFFFGYKPGYLRCIVQGLISSNFFGINQGIFAACVLGLIPSNLVGPFRWQSSTIRDLKLLYS